MDHFQLLQLIEHALQVSQLDADKVNLAANCNGNIASAADDVSRLKAALRWLEPKLQPLKRVVGPPPLPLPSAECVAAFVERHTSPPENAQVVAAAVHDVGILFQLLSAAQATEDVGSAEVAEKTAAIGRGASDDAAVSPELLRRLLKLSSPVVPVVQAELVGQVQPSIGGNAGGPRSVSTQQIAVALAGTTPDRSMWIAGLAAAAVVLIGLGWWMIKIPNAPSDEARSEPQLPAMIPEVELTLQPTDRDSAAPPELDVPDHLRGSYEFIQGLAKDNDVPKPSEDVTQSLVDEGRTDLSADRQRLSEIPNLAPVPMLNQLPKSAVEWTEITGILAEAKNAESQATWHSVALPRTASPRTTPLELDQPSDIEQQASAIDRLPTKWLTLPSSYARGKLAGGSEIVVDQDSSFQAQVNSRQELSIGLSFGSVVLFDLDSETLLKLIDDDTTSDIGLQIASELATLGLRRQSTQLELQIFDGVVLFQGEELPNNTLLRIDALQTITPIPVATPPALPKWAIEFPAKSTIPRAVLASLGSSENLAKSLDEEIVRLGFKLNPKNQLSLNSFQDLCRMRVGLAREDFSVVLTHALWPVRLMAFEQLQVDNTHAAASRTRREMVRRLVAHLQSTAPAAANGRTTAATNNNRMADTTAPVEQVLAWMRMTQGGAPSRQDVAEWLKMLVDNDPLVAAFGDSMLRRKFAGGPLFDPQMPVSARTIVQKAWRQAVR